MSPQATVQYVPLRFQGTVKYWDKRLNGRSIGTVWKSPLTQKWFETRTGGETQVTELPGKPQSLDELKG